MFPATKHYYHRRTASSSLSRESRGSRAARSSCAISKGGPKNLVMPGDLVINSRSDRKGSAGLAARTGSVSLINTVLEPTGINPNFAHHLIRSSAFQEEFFRHGSGIVDDLWTTRYSAMKNIQLPLPPESEQSAIADYLDHETAEIDALIEEQQTLLHLLSERATSVVETVMTRGLAEDPVAPSGFEWPSWAPTGWTVQRASWIFESIGSGTTPSSDDSGAFEGTIPWVTSSELRERGIYKTERYVSTATLARYSSLHLHPAGSLMIAMYGATIGRLGWLEVPATVNQAVCVLSGYRAGPSRFGYYGLLAARRHLLTLASGGGQPNINQEKLRSLRLPIPPAPEQHRIVEFLDKAQDTTTQMENEATQLIEVARERRSALISAAVTGQIDVTERHKPVAEVLEGEVRERV